MSKTYFDKDDIPVAKLEALKTLANNSREDWHELHSHMIEHNILEIVTSTTQLSNNAMVGYFTDRPHFLQDFKAWVREDLEMRSDWPILHTQYLGKNFFFIEFEDLAD